VVAPGDIQGLTTSLLDLARNLRYREQLGEEARRAAMALFDRSVSIARFIRYLEEQQRIVAASSLGMEVNSASGPHFSDNH
jgi:glycosyltransferase involved in cell wall biosynthesis